MSSCSSQSLGTSSDEESETSVSSYEVDPIQSLWDLLPSKSKQQRGPVTHVSHCSNVHVGDLVIVTAPIHVTPAAQLGRGDVTRDTVTHPEECLHEHPRLCMIERGAWGAVPPVDSNVLPDQLAWVVIVDTSTERCSHIDQNLLQVQRLQRSHMQQRGWWDIAYNFLVGGDGNVYEGRGWNVRGSTTLGFNTKSLSIAFLGSFDFQEPPREQLVAALELMEMALRRGQVARDFRILAHQQLRPSASPGEALMNIIRSWPRWSPDVPKLKCDNCG